MSMASPACSRFICTCPVSGSGDSPRAISAELANMTNSPARLRPGSGAALDGASGPGEGAAVREELGDLLFQIIFHARLAAEAGDFTMGEVLDHLARKMIRRHPHVFGDTAVTSARQALAQWEVIKQSEARDAGRVRS